MPRRETTLLWMLQFLLLASSVALSSEGHLAEKLELVLMVGERRARSKWLHCDSPHLLLPVCSTPTHSHHITLFSPTMEYRTHQIWSSPSLPSFASIDPSWQKEVSVLRGVYFPSRYFWRAPLAFGKSKSNIAFYSLFIRSWSVQSGTCGDDDSPINALLCQPGSRCSSACCWRRSWTRAGSPLPCERASENASLQFTTYFLCQVTCR